MPREERGGFHAANGPEITFRLRKNAAKIRLQMISTLDCAAKATVWKLPRELEDGRIAVYAAYTLEWQASGRIFAAS